MTASNHIRVHTSTYVQVSMKLVDGLAGYQHLLARISVHGRTAIVNVCMHACSLAEQGIREIN